MKRLLKKNINTRKFYDEVWSNEMNTKPYYDRVRQEALVKYVKDGLNVLDVGAGVFGSCQFIAERTNIKTNLTCIDFSVKAREIVTERCPDICYVLGRVMPLPFYENEFDCVIAGEIIEHVEKPADFAKELWRVCKPGGVISVSTVDTNCSNAKKHGPYKDHVWEFTPEDLIGLFAPYGRTKYVVVGDYHFIYCRKWNS